MDDHNNAVAGAVVVLEHKASGLRRIVKSNVQGHFTIAHLPPNDYHLTVRAAGYNTVKRDLALSFGQVQELDFPLATASGTVVVDANLTAPTQQGALSEDVVKTESISKTEIQKTGATNLTEAVCHRPGIDVQVECSICNVRSITLDNLPGRYTTLTLDGVPIFSPVSNAYGLDMLGVNSLETIDVSRGAGTSLTTPEALAGTVTLVSRVPTRNEVDGDVSAGDHGYQHQDAYGAKVFDWGAFSVNATHQVHDAVDSIGYGISQYTGYKRELGGVGLFVNDLGGFRIKFRYDHIQEKRMGGPLGDDYDAVLASTTGNPFNWSAGPHGSPVSNGWINVSTGQPVIYNDGEFGMAEIIFTTRNQYVLTANRDFGDTKLHLGFGYAEHMQSSWYGDDSDYWDHQRQGFADVNLQRVFGKAIITLGTNFKYECLHSDSISEAQGTPFYGVLRHDVDAYLYRTPGFYLQAYEAFFHDRLEVNASVRDDHNQTFGSLTTPRLNLLWHHTEALASRFAVGSGYRLPTSFFEQDHGITTDNFVDRSMAKPERSFNASYALTYADTRMAVTASLNHTRIMDMALFVDNYNNTGNFVLQPAQNPMIVDDADIVGTWKATRTDSVTVGLEGYHYIFNSSDAANAALFSRPKYRASFTYDHEEGRFDGNVRATFTGPQDLAKWYDYADTPRFNLDGTPKADQSPTFWVVDMHTSWQFTKHGSIYFNLNNAFNYLQAKHDSYLFTDQYGDLNWTHIWGPGLGRNFVLGLKCSF